MSTRHQWTADELAYLRAHYPTTRTADLVLALGIDARKIYSKAVELGVRKTTETIARMARERSSAPGHGGQRTQFRPGMTPWNKGTHFAPPGSRATQFKAGETNGRARQIEQPIGTLRINYDGYLDRKVSDLPGPPHRRWHPVHRLVWEAAHGPVPKGHVVVFLPGKFTALEHEITLDRVELITRRELMRRNSVHTVQPPELARITQLRGALAQPEAETEPVAWMWQHDETGRIGFIDTWQLENGWRELNPRLSVVGPLYAHPPRDEWRPASEPPEDGRDVVVWCAQERRAVHGMYVRRHPPIAGLVDGWVAPDASELTHWSDVTPPSESPIATKCQRIEGSGVITAT